ncbi:MAG TPA: hypothetical protein PKY56_07125 [Candidatus Kapabacteria bacterium]|nr:hypothetical protein [Candidatus Kapabacteria bacterium]HPO63225.1 hypothetical protein [Candidatus Kapabacteria bacterium]
MKAVIEIGMNDLNIRLVEIINALFKQNVNEVVIRKNEMKLDEFDNTLDISDIVFSLKENGYNDLLIKDIEEGLKNSTIVNRVFVN